MRIRVVAVAAVLLVAGCAPVPDGISQLGCDNLSEFIPELDAVHEGEPATEDLFDRVTASLEGDLFDDETFSLFRLLAEETRDEFDAGFTPVTVRYYEIRGRLFDHCDSVGWPLNDE